MEQRIDSPKVIPGGVKAMLDLSAYIRKSGLEESLINLIDLRASQINGCAYCIDMHWKDLRAGGETEQRLYGLDAWEGVSVLLGARTSRAGMDGSRNQRSRRARTGRNLRAGAKIFHKKKSWRI